MADQTSKAAKDKKKPKGEKKKLKVEGDITQPDEFISDETKTEEVNSTPKVNSEEQLPTELTQEILQTPKEQNVNAAEETTVPVNPEDVKEDIKKFKQQLLQSVAQDESALNSQTPKDEIYDDTEEVLSHIRERSESRPYEVPAPTPPSSDKVLIEIDEKKLAELKEAFLLFDLDGDGCISHNDLKATIISLGQKADDNAVCRMLSEASDPLDFDAFVILLGYRTIELDPEETLIDALAQWDRGGTGLISEERIRHDLVTWGDRFTPREVDWALEEAPTVEQRGDTMIDYIRFCKMLCGLRKAQKKFNE